MKHIGIVDVTTVGACICVNTIVSEAAKQYSSGLHPEFTMHSLSFDAYKKAVVDQNWQAMAELITLSIRKLETVSVDFIIVPSNTPHYAYAEFSKRANVPVLNLIEIIARHCYESGLKKVAVLGTRATMSGNLYSLYLDQYGIEAIEISSEFQEEIDSFIMKEIIPSQITDMTTSNVKKKIQALDCEAVILGCTELPQVYSHDSLGFPAIDTTRLLAIEALSYALS